MHQIGAGTLGPVFRAYEPDQDRLVAVKLFRLDLPPERVHQLVAELDKLIEADLTHPSIAAPIAAGISGTSAYFAQDFVAAESLDIVVRDHGPAPASDALRVATQLGGALDFAAAVDVVHGALHPRDVLVSPDDTRVIGLGIAHALEKVGAAAAIRRPYTAPERAAGKPWDRRADVYSLATLIYEMLAGRRLAVPAEQAGETLPLAPGSDRAALRALFAKALAENPGDRFSTALEFADALKSALTVAGPQPAIVPAASGRARTPAAGARAPEAAARTPKPEQEVALPFEDLHPARSHEIDRAFDTPEPALDLQLHEDAEPVIQLRDEVVIEREAPAPPPSARPAPAPPARSPEPPAAPRAAAPPPAPPVHAAPRPPRAAAREIESDEVTRKRPEPERIAPPTAFIDQSTEEFRESALEKTRSAIWPLALAIGVGLVVGFAGGYGVAMRDRLMPDGAVAQSSPAASSPVLPPVDDRMRQPEPDDATRAAGGVPAVAPETPAATGRPSSPPVAAPAPPPPAAPPTVAAPAGRLLIRSTPQGARVSVDGKDAGTTPATVRELARGAHSVRVTEDGYTTEERRIVLTDERMSQAMRFELSRKPVPGVAPAPPAGPGGLMVESRPTGASVYVDGRLIGTTPLSIESVAAGDHSIALASDGYQRWVGSVRVATGERARVTASLER